MVNPFHESDTDILKEAFPLLEVSVIEDVLYIAKGDINEAFEMLLNMTNDTDKTKLPPQLPNRRNNNNSNTHPNPSLNPFLNNNGTAKPFTVREELAQWRQDLRNESRRKAALRSSNASSPNLSFSFSRTNSSTSSLSSCQSGSNRFNRFNNAHGSFQRPFNSNSRTCNTLRPSISSPNVNIQSHNRNHSIPNDNYSSLSLNALNISRSPPELPRRRVRNSTTGDTNPFVTPNQQQNVTPTTNRQSRASLEADAPALNPFEVPEFPPPPYSEISADTIIHPQ